MIGESFVEKCGRNYGELYAALEHNGTVHDIIENDSEVEFKFNQKNIELIAKYLKPQTSGAGISPFSNRNLPKRKGKYYISDSDLEEYRSIISRINGDNLLVISHITSRFLNDILSKNTYYKNISVSADMKKKCLKERNIYIVLAQKRGINI